LSFRCALLALSLHSIDAEPRTKLGLPSSFPPSPGSSRLDKIMKTAVFVFCLFCASVSFAQVSSIVSQAQPTQMSEHPLHAEQHDMARPQNIYEHSDYTYAQGERPLWEFGPVSQPVPLGDIARLLRQEHALVRKADIIWEN